MEFTFKRHHEGVSEEYTLTDTNEEFLQQLILKILDNTPTGMDVEFLRFYLHEKSMDQMAEAYAAANVKINAEDPLGGKLDEIEKHRQFPKGTGEAYGDYLAIQRASDTVPSFVKEPRTRSFRRQDGQPGAVNYAVRIHCQVCGREAEGWSRDEQSYVKCPSCKTKLKVRRMYPTLYHANQKGQAFKAEQPLDYTIGAELL